MKVLLICSILLSGCAPLASIKEEGGKAVDAAHIGARVTVCEAITIGSVKRQYGSEPGTLCSWTQYCKHEFLYGVCAKP